MSAYIHGARFSILQWIINLFKKKPKDTQEHESLTKTRTLLGEESYILVDNDKPSQLCYPPPIPEIIPEEDETEPIDSDYAEQGDMDPCLYTHNILFRPMGLPSPISVATRVSNIEDRPSQNTRSKKRKKKKKKKLDDI